jgi:hypothetical protein
MGHIYSTTTLLLQGQNYFRLSPSQLKYERTEPLRTHHQMLSNRFKGSTVAEVMNVPIWGFNVLLTVHLVLISVK